PLDDLGTGRLVGAYHVPQVFWIELTREGCGVDEVTEHDGELAPFGLRDRTCGGGRRTRYRLRWVRHGLELCLRGATGCCHLCVTGPDEDVAIFIGGEVLRLNEFGFEVAEESLIQVKLPLQRPIRDALPVAEEVNDLIENRVKIHAPPSHASGGTCSSS